MDYFLGHILLFPYNYAPVGFLQCSGQLMLISQNTALFSLIGNQFGGNGTTNFNLPNLANTSPVPGMEYYIAVAGIYPPRE